MICIEQQHKAAALTALLSQLRFAEKMESGVTADQQQKPCFLILSTKPAMRSAKTSKLVKRKNWMTGLSLSDLIAASCISFSADSTSPLSAPKSFAISLMSSIDGGHKALMPPVTLVVAASNPLDGATAWRSVSVV